MMMMMMMMMIDVQRREHCHLLLRLLLVHWAQLGTADDSVSAEQFDLFFCDEEDLHQHFHNYHLHTDTNQVCPVHGGDICGLPRTIFRSPHGCSGQYELWQKHHQRQNHYHHLQHDHLYPQVSGPDAKLYINAVTTLVFFIISLALVLRPSMR